MHVHMHVSPCELLLVGCAKGGLHPHVMLSGVAAVIHVDACVTALEQAYWFGAVWRHVAVRVPVDPRFRGWQDLTSICFPDVAVSWNSIPFL